MAYVRTVKTASGATAVQIVWSSRRGSRSIEHSGSAHDEVEVEALKAAAAQRLAAGQAELDLGVGRTGTGGAPLEIIASRSAHLWDGVVPRLSRCWASIGRRRGRGVPRSGVGADHRADQQGRFAAGARPRPG